MKASDSLLYLSGRSEILNVTVLYVHTFSTGKPQTNRQDEVVEFIRV